MLLDLGTPLAPLPTDGCARLHVTAVRGREVLGTFLLDTPVDPVPVPVLRDALLERLGRRVAQLVADADARPLASGADGGTAAVVICTRDRPEDLERCLASVAALEGDLLEVVVVDNGSRDTRTRDVVRAAGARYVLEPLPGLDRARNRGLVSTEADLLLCTDDDVEVDPGWAVQLRACFADPLVMAATGLVLPARLDTPSRRRFEAYAGFSRGATRKVLDGTVAQATWAGGMGAGASMAFRAGFLRSIGGFPELLDAGMPTESGGDTYALYRVLRDGFRVVYEPRALAHHHHRREPAQLARAVRGYGTGAMSYLVHAVLEDKDVHAARAGLDWLVERSGRDVVKSLRGAPGAVPLDLLAHEVRGMLRTAVAYPRARRLAAARPPVLDGPTRLQPVEVEDARPPARTRELPPLSVVVPSRGRRETVTRLVRALDRQEYDGARLEVVVALDGDLDGSAAALAELDLRCTLRVVALKPPSTARGFGAGVARNEGAAAARGDVLLFLDDDVDPVSPSVLLAHASGHAADADGWLALVGACAPEHWDVEGAHARMTRNWWIEHVHSKRADLQLGFGDVLTGNLSVTRDAFRRLGGFAPLPRREDWEFGHRFLSAGGRVRAAAGGSVWHDADLDLASALHDRVAEGRGDAIFAGSAAGVAGLLPLANLPHTRLRRQVLQARVFEPKVARAVTAALPAVVRGLQVLEAAQAKRTWRGVNARATEAAYLAGVSQELTPSELSALLAHEPEHPVMEVDLAVDDDEQRLVPPLLDGDVLVTWRGEPVGLARASWGGVPWRQQVLLHRLRTAFGHAADVVRLRGAVL